MKKFLIILAAMSALLCSCNKEAVTPEPIPESIIEYDFDIIPEGVADVSISDTKGSLVTSPLKADLYYVNWTILDGHTSNVELSSEGSLDIVSSESTFAKVYLSGNSKLYITAPKIELSAFQKDSILISTSYSNIKSDFSTCLKYISSVLSQNSIAEMYSDGFRFTNDLTVCVRIISDVLDNKSFSSCTASVLDGYAAVLIAENLIGYHSITDYSVIFKNLLTVSDSFDKLCDCSVFDSKYTRDNPDYSSVDCYTSYKVNKYGFFLSSQSEYVPSYSSSNVVSIRTYTPGLKKCTISSTQYNYWTKYINTEYWPSSKVLEKSSSRFTYLGASYPSSMYIRFSDYTTYGMSNYDVNYFGVSYGTVVYEEPNGICFSASKVSISFVLDRESVFQSKYGYKLRLYINGNTLTVIIPDDKCDYVKNLFRNQFYAAYDSDYYLWSDTVSWWNSLVDSVDFLDNSFKL